MLFQYSTSSLSKPRAPPNPALANATSICPYSSSARFDERLLVLPFGDVAADRQPADLVRERLQLVLGARGEDDLVAGLGGLAGGGGADAGAGAGDEEDLSASSVPYPGECSPTAHTSKSEQEPAETARCRSAARPTCPRAVPTAATAAAAGDVVLRCDDSLRDLQSFRRRAHFRAERGGHGQGKQMHGADGDPLIVAVPPGTQVERWDGTRYDLVRAGQEVTIARGGAGGRGNTRFKSPDPADAATRRDAGCRGRRGASSCTSSCWPTSGSSACRTPASRRCCPGSRARSRRSPPTRSRRSSRCSARSTPRIASS